MPDVSRNGCRAVRRWLLAVAALIFAMVLVGGATRLTESGLSIVEWRPVTGSVPPLSDPQWRAEFEKYQTIPQAQTVNRGMTLDEFKTIYWWEWTHRFLGRIIGAAFLLPFLWFLARGRIAPALRPRLWLIFGLGAVQGGVGWWMVASGLSERVSVSPYRLAFHLTLACAIYAAIVWTWRSLAHPAPAPRYAPPRIRALAFALLALTFVQIYLGGLVAGLDAGHASNTWPLIEDAFVPAAESLWALDPVWRNMFENPLATQFNHRMLAYALWALALLHAVDAWRSDRPVRWGALALATAVTFQAALGIMTVIWGVPLGTALAHQGMALVVLTIATLHAHALAGQGAAVEGRAARPAAPEPIAAGE